ncbi:cardiolipin synthase [Lachnoclostridium edouardi]|uniref:cardiolipin synthase n=1 Tax=Lachnoclostridium edouardi TaxID=1926283 RepID=UPI000C7E8059|nr:cardiolipin synthase [Lachnoclostridium edouardi]
MKQWRKMLRIIFGRTTFLVVSLIFQIIVLLSCFRLLSEYFTYVYGGFVILSAAVVIFIINRQQAPDYKLAWIVPVLVFPVFGALFYLFMELQPGTKRIADRLRDIIKETQIYLQQDVSVEERLQKESQRIGSLARYMNCYGGYPVYENTYAEYFPSGEELFPVLKEKLRNAKDFIFLEYFIIERGKMWNEILEILEEKAKNGVEIRVMYDGMCSLMLLPYHYPRKLEEKGIRCKMFSPVKPALSSYQNNRDHRKILVIDGHTAFTGGINLADEYINEKKRFGYWKDVALMLQGDGVKSFTMMFLQMWEITETKKEDYGFYLPPMSRFKNWLPEGSGFVMPYGDSPLDHETVGEHVYTDILYQAKRYVHIMTPYLILDNDMVTALTYAAKRGVETVIIMPHIPDKKYAYILARSYYKELLEAGVKIYEFTPGFVHAKIYVSDDEKAVVGTINMDYRSFYLHFECAAYLYKNHAVADVEKDFQNTLNQCEEITLEVWRKYPLLSRITGSVLRLFAPLM